MSTPKVKCRHCPAKIEESKMEYHIFQCTMHRPFECDIEGCGLRFASAASIKGHKSSFHTAAERNTTYKCRFCDHGSDDKKAMTRHENHHEQMGGPGFRTRSRSRGPADGARASQSFVGNLNMDNNSPDPDTPTSSARAAAAHRQQPPRRATRDRSRSRNLADALAGARRTSRPRAAADMDMEMGDEEYMALAERAAQRSQTRLTWANVHPTLGTQQQLGEGSSSQTIQTPKQVRDVGVGDDVAINEDNNEPGALGNTRSSVELGPDEEEGMMRLALLNPAYAISRMEGQNAEFDAMVRQIRAQNRELRKISEENGLPLAPDDPMETLIREYEELFGQLPADSDEDGGN